MSSATAASGADAKPNGSAKLREHNQGNQGRSYTKEQKLEVIRIRKCSPTAFYEILGIEKSVSDGNIKKAYRKLSLLTHPDKNGYDGADEAFKMVSRAFQVLSDPDKKAMYDRYGGDPDSRFGQGSASSSGASPFDGFARSPGMRGNSMFAEEITPEELFARFFGGTVGGMGGMGGGFGGFGPFGGGFFDTGPQFVFNTNGGRGFRVHQFGGTRPRTRPPQDSNGDDDHHRPSGLATLANFLPLLILFIIPLVSHLFSSSSSPPAGPSVRFESPVPPNTMHRITPKFNIDYYINPADVADYTPRKLQQLDQRTELQYLNTLQYDCRTEVQQRDRLLDEAQGFFFTDYTKLEKAKTMKLRSCQRLKDLGVSRSMY